MTTRKGNKNNSSIEESSLPSSVTSSASGLSTTQVPNPNVNANITSDISSPAAGLTTTEPNVSANITSDISSTSQSSSSDSIINPIYKPFVVMLPTDNHTEILKMDPKVKLSYNIDYPNLSLGFHHYIHAANDKYTEHIALFKDKKQVYEILNRFETSIDDYDKSISKVSNKHFGENIIDDEFYKLWEILYTFKLINKPNFISVHFEGSGSFLRATELFRKMFHTGKADKHYVLSLDPSEHELTKKHIDSLDKHITAQNYKSSLGKVDFITADGGINWQNMNRQEQDYYHIVLYYIMTAMSIQKHNGNFVCKFYETFTKSSAKLLYILTKLYNHVYMMKPIISKNQDSERYAICTGFKYEDKSPEYKSIYESLSKMHDALHKNPDKHIVDIYEDFQLPKHFTKTLIYINKTIANKHQKQISLINDFIDSQNYHGDAFQTNRDMQIESSEYWISTYINKKPSDNFYKLTETIIEGNAQIIEHSIYF